MTRRPLLLLPFGGLVVNAVFLEPSALVICFSFPHIILHASMSYLRQACTPFVQHSCGKFSPRVHCANFCFALSALFSDVGVSTGIVTQAVTHACPGAERTWETCWKWKSWLHCICLLFNLGTCIAFADMCKKKKKQGAVFVFHIAWLKWCHMYTCSPELPRPLFTLLFPPGSLFDCCLQLSLSLQLHIIVQ